MNKTLPPYFLLDQPGEILKFQKLIQDLSFYWVNYFSIFMKFKFLFEIAGSTSDTKLQKSIEDENQKFGDIIQGDFVDTYHNLSYKAIMGNLWAAEFCEQAEFVVKADDDIFIDLYEVSRRTLNKILFFLIQGV